MKKFILLLLACGMFTASLPAWSHHSFAAQYDPKQPITLEGKVTKVEWTNPHARFYIDVTGSDGTVRNWNIELGSPNFLKRAGWSRKDLALGENVTINGSKARSGADMANAESIILSTGRQVFGRNAADNR